MILVLDKALDILEHLAQDRERAYILGEIAEALRMNQATCANILKTLTNRNYVEHVGKRKGYRLGQMAYTLTSDLSQSTSLLLAAKEVMEKLTAELGETSLLGILRNYKRFALHQVHSNQDLQARSHSERNVYETASGRVLLAHTSQKELENWLRAIGLPQPDVWREASTRAGLESALEKIKEKELAIVYTTAHVVGLAVPIKQNNSVIAALSIFLPEIRCSASRQEEIIQALRKSVKAIQGQLNRTKN